MMKDPDIGDGSAPPVGRIALLLLVPVVVAVILLLAQ
jgi:hypothetical protein